MRAPLIAVVGTLFCIGPSRIVSAEVSSTMVVATAPEPLAGFGVGPDRVYFCSGGVLHAVPKRGGEPADLGRCTMAAEFIADDDAVYFCDVDGVHRVSHDERVDTPLMPGSCVLAAGDEQSLYVIYPRRTRGRRPGLYRLPKSGGDPTRLLAVHPAEQLSVAVDGDRLWLGAWRAGTISLLDRTGGEPIEFTRGERGIVELAVGDDFVTWYRERTGEVRRRRKSGGRVAVVGRGVDTQPVIVRGSHTFWLEGRAGGPRRVMHLPPGGVRARAIARDVQVGQLRADADGLFFIEPYGKEIRRLSYPEGVTGSPSRRGHTNSTRTGK
jgi:hypothetical protein